MKKKYITPETQTVNARLDSSVLDEGAFGKWSQGAAGGDEPGWGDAKENSDIVFDDNFGDLWDNPDAGSNAFDLWGE